MFDEADLTLTEQAFRGNDNRFAGDDKLFVQFHTLPMIDQEMTDKEGRPCYQDVDHIRIMVPGNKESVIDRPVSEMDRARFRKHYENWKAGQEEKIYGTPLEAASKDPSNPHLKLSLSQIEELKYFNVRTVEQLASVADVHAQKFMGIALLKTSAQKYLESAKERAGEAYAKAALSEALQEVETLKKAIQEQATMIAGLKAVQEKQGKGAMPPRSRAKAG